MAGATRQARMEDLCRETNVSLSALYPPSDGIVWGSLQINADSIAQLHRDKNNVGLSLICLFGNFDGGELLSGEGQVWLSCPGDVLCFDGTQPHASSPYTGRRYSIVAFQHESAARLSSHDRAYLSSLCFPLPAEMTVPFPFPHGGNPSVRLVHFSHNVSSPLGHSPLCPDTIDVLATAISSPLLASIPREDFVSQVSDLAHVIWFTFPHVSPAEETSTGGNHMWSSFCKLWSLFAECCMRAGTRASWILEWSIFAHVAIALCSRVPPAACACFGCVSCMCIPGAAL